MEWNISLSDICLQWKAFPSVKLHEDWVFPRTLLPSIAKEAMFRGKNNLLNAAARLLPRQSGNSFKAAFKNIRKPHANRNTLPAGFMSAFGMRRVLPEANPRFAGLWQR